MTPEQVALWWQTATKEQRKEFCLRVGAVRIRHDSFWIYLEDQHEPAVDSGMVEASE